MAIGKKTGGGSRKGRPNKSTEFAREAIARLVETNVHRVERWLDEIETQEGPKAAFDCFMDLVEYHVPKLARTELTGRDGAAMQTVTTTLSPAAAEKIAQALATEV